MLTVGNTNQIHLAAVTRALVVEGLDKVVEHEFILSKTCPIDLCGRDLMKKMCLTVHRLRLR